MPTLVVDIGGGSTELIIGKGEETSATLDAGGGRPPQRALSRERPADRQLELEALAADMRGLIEERPAARGGRGRPEAGIAVADTASSLMAIETQLGAVTTDSSPRHGAGAASIQRMLSLLGAPAGAAPGVAGMLADRAPTIVAGVVILVEAMRAFGLERITVSGARHPLRRQHIDQRESTVHLE